MEKIYVLNRYAQIIDQNEEQVIIHVKNEDKYYVFPSEIFFVLLSFNGIRTIDMIVSDTSKYYKIKKVFIEAFVKYYVELLSKNGVIEENDEYNKVKQSR